MGSMIVVTIGIVLHCILLTYSVCFDDRDLINTQTQRQACRCLTSFFGASSGIIQILRCHLNHSSTTSSHGSSDSSRNMMTVIPQVHSYVMRKAHITICTK